MPYEITVGLHVADPATYTQYRTEIAPLLAAAGAEFRHDFEISQTLRTTAPHPINRLFILRFPTRDSKQRFFADPIYQAIRARLFNAAVQAVTTLSEYET